MSVWKEGKRKQNIRAAWILILCGTVFAGWASHSDSGSAASSAEASETHSSEESSANALAKLDYLFPEAVDPDGYCEGMKRSSSLWKADQGVDVYVKDGHTNGLGIVAKTIPAGEEFRIIGLGVYTTDKECGYSSSDIIAGRLADDSGIAVLYSRNLENPVCATLIRVPAWPMEDPFTLKAGLSFYDAIDGTMAEGISISDGRQQCLLKNWILAKTVQYGEK